VTRKGDEEVGGGGLELAKQTHNFEFEFLEFEFLV
jgi:hypothetical protein